MVPNGKYFLKLQFLLVFFFLITKIEAKIMLNIVLLKYNFISNQRILNVHPMDVSNYFASRSASNYALLVAKNNREFC